MVTTSRRIRVIIYRRRNGHNEVRDVIDERDTAEYDIRNGI